MPAQVPIVDAQRELTCGNTLGEGILWDSKTGLVHWIDINEAELHSYDPETKNYSVDSYKSETEFLSTIALRKDAPGFIALFQHDIVLLPAATTPTSTAIPAERTQRKAEKYLAAPLPADPNRGLPTRFNDGAAAPDGSFYGGSMTIPEVKDGLKRGELWKYEADGKQTKILDAVGTSNGLGWTNDGKTMFYVDSADHQVLAQDYVDGLPSNPRVIATTPEPMPPATESKGVFDGLCVDGLDNVWVARWSDERIVGYTRDGKMLANIRVKGCKCPTIPCFGGKNLDVMYIASAHSKLSVDGDQQDRYPDSGHLFKVDFGPGSEIRKLLPENWSGADRWRFAG